MGAEEVCDLLRVFVFLGAQEAVVEDPVVGFGVFVFGSQECYGGVHQFEHLVTAFNALSILFDAGFFVGCTEVCIATKLRVMKQASMAADPNICFPNALLDKLPVDPAPGVIHQLSDFLFVFLHEILL